MDLFVEVHGGLEQFAEAVCAITLHSGAQNAGCSRPCRPDVAPACCIAPACSKEATAQ